MAEFTPENIKERWAEYSLLRGTVPAYGFYARHVKGLTLKNIDISTTAKDERPPVVFVDVSNAKISDTPEPDKR